MKTCTTCLIEKPLDEFHKHKAGKFGVRSICKSCSKKYNDQNKDRNVAYQKEYAQKNSDRIRVRRHAQYVATKDQVLAQSKAWREANAEKAAATRRAHYLRNKEKNIIQSKEWRANNPDRVRENRERYTEINRERMAEYSKQYYADNRDRYAEQGAKWYAENKAQKNKSASEWKRGNLDKIREYNNRRRAARVAAGDSYTAEEAASILEAQMHLCANELCVADLKVIKKHLDHKTPLVRGGSNGKENLQWLCAKCNLSKAALTDEEWRRKLRLLGAA